VTTVADLRDVLANFLEELEDEFDDPHEIEQSSTGIEASPDGISGPNPKRGQKTSSSTLS